MASYTSTGRSKHVITPTVGGTADTVVLDRAYPSVEIINADPTNGLYVSLAYGPADTLPSITAAVDGSWYVGPGAVRTISDDQYATAPASKLEVISSAAVAEYHITGLSS